MDNTTQVLCSIIATFIIFGIMYAIGKKKDNPKIIRIGCYVLVLEVSFACGGLLFGLILSGVYFLAHYLDNKVTREMGDEEKKPEAPTVETPTVIAPAVEVATEQPVVEEAPVDPELTEEERLQLEERLRLEEEAAKAEREKQHAALIQKMKKS